MPRRSTFDYTAEQWAQIAKSIQHFETTHEAIEVARLGLQRAAQRFSERLLDGPGFKQKNALVLKHWITIGKLADALMSEFTWLDGNEPRPPDPSGNVYKPYAELFLALKKISRIPKMRAESDNLIDSYPKTTAKAAYHSDVLDVWTDFGGKLKISRHPNTGKIKGPLARYFSAVTQPVHGGSPESLPDIIERHLARKAALEKWRLDMGLDNPLS